MEDCTFSGTVVSLSIWLLTVINWEDEDTTNSVSISGSLGINSSPSLCIGVCPGWSDCWLVDKGKVTGLLGLFDTINVFPPLTLLS